MELLSPTILKTFRYKKNQYINFIMITLKISIENGKLRSKKYLQITISTIKFFLLGIRWGIGS